MSKLGDELVEAMREAAAYMEGTPGETVTHQVTVPDEVDVLAIRKGFARRFGLDPRAVQDWEQGRRRPDRTARILLRTIQRHPEAVEDALQAGS